MRNKIIHLREAIGYLSPDYLVLYKTKLGNGFPSAQFSIPSYKIQARWDRDDNGGGPFLRNITKLPPFLSLSHLAHPFLSLSHLTLKLLQANEFALKLLYVTENGYDWVSVDHILMKIWK